MYKSSIPPLEMQIKGFSSFSARMLTKQNIFNFKYLLKFFSLDVYLYNEHKNRIISFLIFYYKDNTGIPLIYKLFAYINMPFYFQIFL